MIFQKCMNKPQVSITFLFTEIQVSIHMMQVYGHLNHAQVHMIHFTFFHMILFIFFPQISHFCANEKILFDEQLLLMASNETYMFALHL